MLSRLTSYIYGGTASEPTREQTNVSLRAIEQEDNDWLLVERGSNNGSLNGDDRPTLTDSEDECKERRSPSPTFSRRSRSSSACSQFSSASLCSSRNLSWFREVMEESWLVTPPPCFTHVELPPTVRSSSLENLLIEHPSLTVLEARFESNYRLLMQNVKPDVSETLLLETIEHYRQVRDLQEFMRSGDEFDSDGEFSQTDESEEAITAETHSHEMDAEESQQKKEALIAAGKIHKIMNKKTRRQSYNRGPMERNNKAREVNGRNCKRRRSDHSQAQRNSRANNNRKC